MRRIEKKRAQLARRKLRVRGTVFGTPERPRLTVYRSIKQIYAQVIDDMKGLTLVSANSRSKALATEIKRGGNKIAAATVGKAVAQAAIQKGITQVVFDRSGFRYHGRIKALADAAREAGLKF